MVKRIGNIILYPEKLNWRLTYIIVFSAYVLFNLSLLLFHEPWRDETQAWLISKDAGLDEFFYRAPVEGHPVLWWLIMSLFSKTGAPFLCIQLLNLLIMYTAAAVFLKHSPLHPLINTAVIFSPFFTYYFPVICRPYSLALLLMVIIAVLLPDKKTHRYPFAVCVALLIQTHIYMLGMAFALCLSWLAEIISELCRTRNKKVLKDAIPLFIPLVSAVFLILQLKQKEGQVYISSTSWLTSDNMGKILLMAALWIIASLFSKAFFRENNVIYTAIFTATTAWLFQYFIVRYIYDILLVQKLMIMAWSALWAVFIIKKSSGKKWTDSLFFYFFVYIVFLHSNVSIAFVPLQEYTEQYSGAKAAAEFIKENFSEKDQYDILVANDPTRMTSVIAYLPEYSFRDMNSSRKMSYRIWEEEEYSKDVSEIIEYGREIFPNKEKINVIICAADSKYTDRILRDSRIKILFSQKEQNMIMPDEKYIIFTAALKQ